MALLAALAGFGHLVAGFNNHQLAERVAALLDAPYTSRQATYDLRRLRRKGIITRRPHSNRYDLTPEADGSPSSSRRPTAGSSPRTRGHGPHHP